MEKDDEILEMQMDDEELLNFDLGDLSPEDMEQEPAEGDADDEIIELMDLVEKGEAAGAGDVAELPEEDRPTKEEGDVEAPKEDLADAGEPSEGGDGLEQAEADLDLSDISLDSDLGTEEEAEPEEEISGEGISQVDLQDILDGDETNPDLDLTYDSSFEPEESLEDLMGEAELGETAATYEAEPEDEIGEEDISESDLEEILEESDSQMNMTVEAPLPSEVSPEDTLSEMDMTIEAPLPSETLLDEVFDEEPAEAPTEVPQDIVPEPEEAPSQPPAGELAGISEEKIEAIVARVVQDTVERVARETMANVAEKIITEAINTLKQSLETDPD